MNRRWVAQASRLRVHRASRPVFVTSSFFLAARRRRNPQAGRLRYGSWVASTVFCPRIGTMNLVGTARCAVRAAFSGATVPPATARAGTSLRDVPTRVRFMIDPSALQIVIAHLGVLRNFRRVHSGPIEHLRSAGRFTIASLLLL